MSTREHPGPSPTFRDRLLRPGAVVAEVTLVVLVAAALTLSRVDVSVTSPPVSDNPTPLGYTWSLVLFILPLLYLVAWFLLHPEYTIQRKAVGFIYLTFAKLPEQSEDEQAALDEVHDSNPDYWISMLFFTVFADNAVRWLEGSEDAYWFWLFSGDSKVLAVFGGLSVLILFFYWSRIGQMLRQPD